MPGAEDEKCRKIERIWVDFVELPSYHWNDVGICLMIKAWFSAAAVQWDNLRRFERSWC